MPEGDTVRRVAVRLGQALAGRPLVRAELRWGELGAIDLVGRTVVDVDAYGKHLLIRLAPEQGPPAELPGTRRPTMSTAPAGPTTVHAHLRMDGWWNIEPTGQRPPFADHRVRAILGNNEWTAVGYLLGELDLVPMAEETQLLAHLGPDVMADDFPTVGLPQALAHFATDPQRPIGAALLDQRMAAGMGTIFMSESLFRQRISPWTRTADVDLRALLLVASSLLVDAARSTPATAEFGRSAGRYVHGRAGQRCRRCGARILVAQIGQPPRDRPAFYCPRCQIGPAPKRA